MCGLQTRGPGSNVDLPISSFPMSLLFSGLFMALRDHGPFLDSNLAIFSKITCAYHMYIAFPGNAMLVSNVLGLLCSLCGLEPSPTQ
jgi:hypothetical protein